MSEDSLENSVPDGRKDDLMEKYPDLFDMNGNIVRGRGNIAPEDEADIAKLQQKHSYLGAQGIYEQERKIQPVRKPTPSDHETAREIDEGE